MTKSATLFGVHVGLQHTSTSELRALWRKIEGLGFGWSEIEYNAYGIPFPSVKVRMDQLEEAAQCVHGLLRNEATNFSGMYFSLTNAKCVPKPVQTKLPIWIGGGGEKRTLNIAAKYADGWNVPFISPEAFAHKRSVLHSNSAPWPHM